MSWFGFGDSDRPNDIQHNFGYDLNTVDYSPDEGLLGSIGNLQGISEKQMGMGDQFSQSYKNMMDPSSPWYQRMFGNLRKDVGGAYARANVNTQQAMAQRGMGKGGMTSLLSAIGGNRMGEQLRKGYSGITDVGLQRAGQFGQLATGAYGSAGDMTTKAGGLQSGIDARRLQTDTTNVSAQNAFQQYLNTSRYNLKMANQQRQDSYDNQRANQRGAFWRGVGSIGVGLATGNPMMAVGGLTGMMGGGGGGAYNPSQSTGLAMSNFPGQYDLSGSGGYGQNNFGLNTPTLDFGEYSDIRLKNNIKQIGIKNGFNLYEFNYKWNDKKYIGVMAQDILKTNPESVKKINGYYAVDYKSIGLEFKEVI